MDWIEEHALGQEARLLTMHKELHPRSDIDCISRNAGRRGLLNIENIVNLAIIHYILGNVGTTESKKEYGERMNESRTGKGMGNS